MHSLEIYELKSKLALNLLTKFHIFKNKKSQLKTLFLHTMRKFVLVNK